MSFLVELPEDQFNPEAFGNGVPVGGFNMNSARAMAWISQLAYETRLPDKIERIAMLWKFDDIRILQ
jgi:triacylglycerol lipase